MTLNAGGMDFDDELDALGLLCPLPVLKAAKRLRGMEPGRVLKIITDDPAAIIDVPHFCAEQGHALLGTEDQDGAQVHYVRRKPA